VKFVREGNLRGLFKDRTIISMLTGEPEYLDSLKDETPKDWIVTGYPWSSINTPDHTKFLAAYRTRYKDYPRMGSLMGYSNIWCWPRQSSAPVLPIPKRCLLQ
jgi:branched-chain amino acid transport system substrate-binding protein